MARPGGEMRTQGWMKLEAQKVDEVRSETVAEEIRREREKKKN